MSNLPRWWRTEKIRYRLAGETCQACGKSIFPPRDICPHCGEQAEPPPLEQKEGNNLPAGGKERLG